MAQVVAQRRADGRVAGVIDEEMTIEVRKCSVPTLELVDLPGIVAAHIEGEPAGTYCRYLPVHLDQSRG